MISRIFIFLYSVVCYLASFVAILYAIGFIGDFVVPKTIDSGAQSGLMTALAYDLPLLALFALQHSIMARQGFKRVWTRVVPKPAERATYVLAAAAVLGLLFWLWRPLPATVWTVSDPVWAGVLTALFFLGWLIVLISTNLINHLELFGLEQSLNHLRGKEPQPPAFKTPLFYKLVRHPIYAGMLIAFWATPHMTEGRLLFALATTVYIFLGIALEERDLVAFFGQRYRDYREAVPMVIPFTKLPRRASRRTV